MNTSIRASFCNRLAQVRPSLVHRSFHERPLLVESASGHYITLDSGKRILDGCGGAAVSCLGHGHPEVAEAMVKQIQAVGYVHTAAYTTRAAEDLADLLVDGHPGGLCKAFLLGSGSEATDGAMKMARQYFFEKGEHQRQHYITRRQGYHGNTIGSMSISNNASRLVPYRDILMSNVSYVSPCYAYRDQGNLSEPEYVAKLAQELEDEFQRIGPEKVIAFMAETIGGATSGCLVPVPGYLKAMKEVCRHHGALFILDEVMCGMGRCGSLFAWQAEGDSIEVAPDIMTTGKGLGGGYAPIAAILATQDVISILSSGSGAFCHGHTYQAHPVCSAAALAVQTIIRRDNLVARCAEIGEMLLAKLKAKFAGEPHVGDVRGRGLFVAVEFVKDKKSKRALPPSLSFGPRVQHRALDLGVAVYPGKGTIDGISGDHVLIAPSFTISDFEIVTIVERLHEAYLDVVKELLN
ncbi:aminotransferase class-III [Xylariaceae sp. FL0255]|nr:aminotransferase class-III [Xylariaceae sp. FL0255]